MDRNYTEEGVLRYKASKVDLIAEIADGYGPLFLFFTDDNGLDGTGDNVKSIFINNRSYPFTEEFSAALRAFTDAFDKFIASGKAYEKEHNIGNETD